MQKRANLSLSVIVMAVIALLILIVLTYITLNGSSNFTTGVNACNTGEACVETVAECDIGFQYDVAIPKSCTTSSNVKGNYCCRKV